MKQTALEPCKELSVWFSLTVEGLILLHPGSGHA